LRLIKKGVKYSTKYYEMVNKCSIGGLGVKKVMGSIPSKGHW